MKTRKLNFEDFKKNQLERKQLINISGAGAGSPDFSVFDNSPTPTGGGTGGDGGAGTANPKP
ncbi:hypothetical protein SAMN05660845_1260 [Flavobacterium swingsii]|uniref:Uncharacterized protein n=1 Tax=Flavobacterium swingsii TaxID=498292 RepID=A0A1I0XJ45_9FLAO|nr:hypothetical protein [Flavobacterium swingsii]SFB00446.1 hypothetical protein SAMN05660845_1260 [Flavobacterium swingsii]